MTPRILAFSGSLRTGSYNHLMVQNAANGAKAAGAEVTVIRLADFNLPVFDEDLEAKGTPDGAKRLKELMKSHHGLLIASPEYNSSVTAALKNAIDWASRPAPNEKPLECFAYKVAGLMGASPGNLGGLRGLVHLRAILGNIQTLVIPDQYALIKAHEAFDDKGIIKDEKQRAAVENIGKRVAEVARKLNA